MNVLLPVLILAAVSAVAPPVEAQDSVVPTEDWTLTVIPEQKVTLAVAEFTSGVSLAARCVDGAYDLLITGLPEAPPRTTKRDLAVSVGDTSDFRTTVWSVGENRTAAFSRVPAMVARQMAEGGPLQIVVPGGEGKPRTRYVMALNPSNTAIEQTLTACGRPLIDVRDKDVEGNGQDGLPPAVTWATTPRPRFPAPLNGRSPVDGYAVLSCVARSDGRLEHCQIESESPRGYNLGRESLRSIDRARVRLTPEGVTSGKPLEDRMILFSVNYVMR
ncbi:MAG: hypothetical protein ACK4M2_03050 [Brevundimonas sp.]